MKKVVIEKEVLINATKEKIWEVLTEDKPYRIWTAEFCEGSHFQTDWKEGSKILFKTPTGEGLVSKLMECKPNEIISMEHQGILLNNEEVYDNEEAEKWKGMKEIYSLSGKDGATVLSIYQELEKSYEEWSTYAWDKALFILKELAESGHSKYYEKIVNPG
ncbi:MAG TPA: SRPBCC domain-containing protein [Ignavibacteria bacterium]|nr:SRPBCC domain-containing protein [Ignavibacteria bacterium]